MNRISKNDKLFQFKKEDSNSFSIVNSYFGWEGSGALAFNNYACGYAEAAKLIYNRIKKASIVKEIELTDTLIFPLIFLYRHAVELKIKYFYFKYSYEKDDARETFLENNHNLQTAWETTRVYIDKLLMEQNSKLKLCTVDSYVNQINYFDAKSMKFRYPIDKKLNLSTNQAVILNVENFNECMLKLFDYFKQIDFEIDNKISHINFEDSIITKKSLIELISKNLININKIILGLKENKKVFDENVYNLDYESTIVCHLLLYTGRDIKQGIVKLSLNDEKKEDFAKLLLLNFNQIGYDLKNNKRELEFKEVICSKMPNLVLEWLEISIDNFKMLKECDKDV